MSSDPFHCPECGAEVSPNAASCPCGARKENGQWISSETYDGLDLPGDDFDYGDFVEREFGGGISKRSFRDFFWWLVALITLIAFVLLSSSMFARRPHRTSEACPGPNYPGSASQGEGISGGIPPKG